MPRVSSFAGFAAAATALLLSAPSCERQRASTAENFYEEVMEKTEHLKHKYPGGHDHAKPPPAKPAGENAVQPESKKREDASGKMPPANRAEPAKDPTAPGGPAPSPAAGQPPVPPADKLVPGEKK